MKEEGDIKLFWEDYEKEEFEKQKEERKKQIETFKKIFEPPARRGRLIEPPTPDEDD